MSRLSFAALAGAAMLFSATAAQAQGYYTAKPATAPTKPSLISGGVMWKCAEGTCAAAKTTSRDAIVCEQIVKHVGTLSSFAAGANAFDEAALAKCNARAK
jgi:hypothetical protein